MNIYLIGYRCTGKTTIGKILADHLHHGYLDMDKTIEQQTGSTISGLVQTHGWAYFRQVEKKILLKTGEMKDTVVSTGGGIVTDPENLDFLTTAGYTIWLDADIRTILSRLNSDTTTFSSRPPLTGKNLINETEELLNLRRPLYAKAAHLKIETGLHTPKEIIALIERRLP
jgi:shikimate kinase